MPPDEIQTSPAPPAAGAPPAASPAAPPPAPPPGGASPETPPPTPKPTGITLTTQQLNERIARARQAVLKELGVEDPEKLRAIMEEHKALKAGDEKRRRAEMTELQRAQDDAKRYRDQLATVQAQLLQAKMVEANNQQQSTIARISAQYIDSSYSEEAQMAFARTVLKMDERMVAKMTERDIAKWFKTYSQQKPAFAKKADPAKRVDAPPRPAGAPSGPPRPRDPSHATQGGPTNKTFRPGQSNSMTQGEVRAELAKRGLNF